MLSPFEVKKNLSVVPHRKKKNIVFRIDDYLNNISNEISKIQLSSESVDHLVKLLLKAGTEDSEVMIMGNVSDMHLISHANADFVNINCMKTICMGVPEMTAFANDFEYPYNIAQWLNKRRFTNGSILIGIQLDRPSPLITQAFIYNRKNKGVNILMSNSVGTCDNVDIFIPIDSRNTLAACDILQIIFHFVSCNIAYKTNGNYLDKGAASLGEYCSLLLQSINSSFYSRDTLADISMLLNEKIREGRSVFTFGNGGSAAMGSYFADGLKALCKARPKHKRNIIDVASFASSIVSSLSSGTYESAFTRIIKSLGVEDGDILIGVSSSGNSQNIIHPFLHISGVDSVGILGFDNGGVIGENHMAQIAFAVPDVGRFKSYQRAEDGQRIALSSILSTFDESQNFEIRHY